MPFVPQHHATGHGVEPPQEGRNTPRGHGRANIDSSRRVTAPGGFNGGNGERSFGSSSGGRESLMTPRN